MQVKLEFSEEIADYGVYAIYFGDKFLITRSSKIIEWAEKIVSDINEALKMPDVPESHSSSKVIAHVKSADIKTALVVLIEATSRDEITEVQNRILQENEGNDMCLNKKFHTRWNGANNTADPGKKKFIPYKLIHERRNAKKQS